MNVMLGLVLGIGTSTLVVAMSWKSYRKLADPLECEAIEALLKSDGNRSARGLSDSRPGLLLGELALLGNCPEHQVAAFNEALSDVDSSTRLELQASKALARVAFLVGMAGGAVELSVPGGSIQQAALWAAGAVLVGLLGAAVCTVMGQMAVAGISRRRRLWDEFVRSILNSQFPRTELRVPGVHQHWAKGAGPEEEQPR